MPYRATLTYTTCSLLLALNCNPSPAAAKPATSLTPTNPATAVTAADTAYKTWSFTPTGVYGRIPLNKPKNRNYVRISHPAADLAIIQSINPAGIVINTTRIYFKDGLLHLSTETNRWDDTYDSVWYRPDGPGKFLVTERKRGVNPILPCKYVQYTFRNDLLTDIICYLDSIRAGADQEGVAHYVFERYDDPARRGLVKTETFFTEIDAPTVSRTRDCHKWVNDYDAKGELVSRSIYDPADQPVRDRFGIFQAKYKYDNDDNETEVDYYDTKGNLAVTALGYAEKISEYKHGLLTTETYYLDHMTITRTSRLADSVSIVWHKYDQDGNLKETEYFDAQNQPTVNATGVHKVLNEYSPDGMLIQVSRIGLYKVSGLENKMYGLIKFDHDTKGRMTGMQLQNNTGLNLAGPDGAYLIKYGYDDWGRNISQSCWRDNSTRMACSLGYFQTIHRYNGDGQLIEVDHTDEYGNPNTGTVGYSKELISHNEQGLPVDRTYFDGDRPVTLIDSLASMSGFHRLQYGYDGFNRLRTISFFDLAGRPVNAAVRSGALQSAAQGARGKEWTASQISLDYNGALLITESFRDSGDTHPPVVLNCATGECLPQTAFEAISRVQTTGTTAVSPGRTYHARFQPDTLFNNQLGFIGDDSILVFLTTGSRVQTNIACADLYRLETVNKFYQLEGLVTDYYLSNDSLAATYNYDHGHLEGPVNLYYRNGRVHERGTYRNGFKSGVWEYFYDNGQKERTLQYDENGAPQVVDCYSKNGDVLARDGNGQFVGKVAFSPGGDAAEVTARGNIRNGLPDGEWDLFTAYLASPANIEHFSGGKFRRGVSNSTAGSVNYSDKWYTRLDGPHPYEVLDFYQQSMVCSPDGRVHLHPDLYFQIRNGFNSVLIAHNYVNYSGWIFLDVRVDGSGHVLDAAVRLHQPDEGFAKAIRNMAEELVYPTNSQNTADQVPFEKQYIILVDGTQIVIPEEVLQAKRSGQ